MRPRLGSDDLALALRVPQEQTRRCCWIRFADIDRKEVLWVDMNRVALRSNGS